MSIELSAKAKLAKIQSELKAPKNLYNQFGKFAYRNTSGILMALKPLLEDAHMLLELEDTIEQIGDRFYLKATATLTDLESGITLESSAYAREQDTVSGQVAAQITGAASTYARKYALNGLFLIDDSEADPDDERNDPRGEAVRKVQAKEEARNEAKKKPEQKKVMLITPSQIEIIKKGMSEERIASMCDFFKIESIEQMTMKNASDTIKKLQKKEAD